MGSTIDQLVPAVTSRPYQGYIFTFSAISAIFWSLLVWSGLLLTAGTSSLLLDKLNKNHLLYKFRGWANNLITTWGQDIRHVLQFFCFAKTWRCGFWIRCRHEIQVLQKFKIVSWPQVGMRSHAHPLNGKQKTSISLKVDSLHFKPQLSVVSFSFSVVFCFCGAAC